MAEKIKLVQGDTRPQIRFSLTDDTTGQVIDITGSTVYMKFRAVGSDTILFTRTGTLIPGIILEDGSVSTAAPYNIAGSGGLVVFTFAAGNLDIEPGPYEAELEVVFGDGGVQTVYQLQKFIVRADF